MRLRREGFIAGRDVHHLAKNRDGDIQVSSGFLGVDSFLHQVRSGLRAAGKAHQQRGQYRDHNAFGCHDLKLLAQCYPIVTAVSCFAPVSAARGTWRARNLEVDSFGNGFPSPGAPRGILIPDV